MSGLASSHDAFGHFKPDALQAPAQRVEFVGKRFGFHARQQKERAGQGIGTDGKITGTFNYGAGARKSGMRRGTVHISVLLRSGDDGGKSSRNPLIVRYIDDENKIFGILNSLALF